MDLMESKLGQHFENRPRMLEKIANYAKVLHQPSPEWETSDFKGRNYSTNLLRGKVSLLDFWYHGCGSCIENMPQIKELRRRFEGKPVVVLAMNTDKDPEDAEYVIEKMRLDYPNLKARDLSKKYGVCVCPTYVIIDQKGIVRDIYTGASPYLVDKISKSIEILLNEK